MLRRYLVHFVVTTATTTFVSVATCVALEPSPAAKAVWIATERARHQGADVKIKEIQ